MQSEHDPMTPMQKRSTTGFPKNKEIEGILNVIRVMRDYKLLLRTDH